MEEVEEEFELVEQHHWQEVHDVVLLVVDCVRCCVRRVAATVQPDLPLDSHVHIPPAAAQQPPTKPETAVLSATEHVIRMGHLCF